MSVSYDGAKAAASSQPAAQAVETPVAASSNGSSKEILAPLEGKIYMTKDASESAIKVGDAVKVGDIVCYIEAMKVSNAVKSEVEGVISEVLIKDADDVLDDDVIF